MKPYSRFRSTIWTFNHQRSPIVTLSAICIDLGGAALLQHPPERVSSYTGSAEARPLHLISGQKVRLVTVEELFSQTQPGQNILQRTIMTALFLLKNFVSSE